MSAILMYHSVSDHFVAPGLQVRPATFRKHFEWVREAGYEIGTVAEAVAAPRQKRLAVTFDDGFADNLPAFEWLLTQHIQATLFVCPDVLGTTAAWATRPEVRSLPLMAVEQLRASAQAGIEVGSHSWSHTSFNQLSAEEAESSLIQGIKWFQDNLNFRPDLLAYPYGHCPSHLQAAVEKHFDLALAVEPLPGLPFRLAVPRMPALEELDREAFLLQLQRYDLQQFAEPPGQTTKPAENSR